ncbi:hypothetical protein DFH06DRAFT_1131288 [Mycena polygramma]|nr:hypothetical protein DFH06DRAFT_1131288 [Mycena polygramma]
MEEFPREVIPKQSNSKLVHLDSAADFATQPRLSQLIAFYRYVLVMSLFLRGLVTSSICAAFMGEFAVLCRIAQAAQPLVGIIFSTFSAHPFTDSGMNPVKTTRTGWLYPGAPQEFSPQNSNNNVRSVPIRELRSKFGLHILKRCFSEIQNFFEILLVRELDEPAIDFCTCEPRKKSGEPSVLPNMWSEYCRKPQSLRLTFKPSVVKWAQCPFEVPGVPGGPLYIFARQTRNVAGANADCTASLAVYWFASV